MGLGTPVLDSCRLSFGRVGGTGGSLFAGATLGFVAGISGTPDNLPFASVVGLTGVTLARCTIARVSFAPIDCVRLSLFWAGSFVPAGTGVFCFGGTAVLGCVLTGETGNFFGAVTGIVPPDLGPLGFTSVSKLDRLVGVAVPDLTGSGLLSVFFGRSPDLFIGEGSLSSERCFFLSK